MGAIRSPRRGGTAGARRAWRPCGDALVRAHPLVPPDRLTRGGASSRRRAGGALRRLGALPLRLRPRRLGGPDRAGERRQRRDLPSRARPGGDLRTLSPLARRSRDARRGSPGLRPRRRRGPPRPRKSARRRRRVAEHRRVPSRRRGGFIRTCMPFGPAPCPIHTGRIARSGNSKATCRSRTSP